MAIIGQQRKNLRLSIAAGVAVLVCLLLAVAWRFSVLGQAPVKLERELQSAKLDGLPLDVNELRQQLRIDESQNAAPQLGIALAELKEWKQTQMGKAVGKLVNGNKSLSSLTTSQLEEIRPGLDGLASVFAALAVAVTKPKLDFHRPWEQGPAVLYSELPDEKACVVLLVAKAKSDLLRGQTSSAMNSLDIASKLSALIGQDPILIGLLVQCAVRTHVVQVVADVIRSHPNDEAVLNRCRQILKDMGPQPDIRPAMRSEFVSGRIAVKMLADPRNANIFGNDGGNTVTRLARFSAVRNMYEWRLTEVYRRVYRALSQRPQSFVAMNAAFADVQTEVDDKVKKDWSYGLVEMLSPVFTSIPGVLAESEARRNVLYCAMDILDAKRKAGSFPANLLGSTGYWLDPTTDHPLTYKRTGTGFLIYSFGKDGKDDGGKPRNYKSTTEAYDIPFSFPK